MGECRVYKTSLVSGSSAQLFHISHDSAEPKPRSLDGSWQLAFQVEYLSTFEYPQFFFCEEVSFPWKEGKKVVFFRAGVLCVSEDGYIIGTVVHFQHKNLI